MNMASQVSLIRHLWLGQKIPLLGPLCLSAAVFFYGGSNDVLADRPNIILINLDDCDMDLVSEENLVHFPNLKQFASQSVRFTNCHVTTPLCGPSRACLLRCQYAHNTGYRTNRANLDVGGGFTGGTQFFNDQGLDKEQLPVWMQRAGYHTIHVGKFYQGKTSFVPVPAWDQFFPWLGNLYFDSHRIHFDPQGNLIRGTNKGYRTEGETDNVLQCLDSWKKQTGGDKPFFLSFAPVAPHAGIHWQNPIPEKWKGRFADVKLPDPESQNEENLSDKPSVYRVTPVLTEHKIQWLHEEQRKRKIAMLGVDQMMQRLRAYLSKKGLADNTIVMLTSDHGYLVGQHRQYGKALPLDRTTRVPLWVYWPARKAKPRDKQHLLAHIDITATIAELGTATLPDFVDGRSFAKLLRDDRISELTAVRDTVLIENWESRLNAVMPQNRVYSSIRKPTTHYVEWATGEKEFYDFKQDPHQLNNGYDALNDNKKASLAAELASTRKNATGDNKPEVTFAFPTINAKFIGPEMEISGYAESTQGVDSVWMSLMRISTRKYWNGSSWQDAEEKLAVELPNRDRAQSQWWLRPGLAGKLQQGEGLKLSLHFRDAASNRIESIREMNVVFDGEPPQVAIRRPANQQSYREFSNFGGLIEDNNRVERAYLIIYNLDTLKYFDGESWYDQQVEAPAHTNVLKGNFHARYQIPPGRYRISAIGKDAAGNLATAAVPHYMIVNPKQTSDRKKLDADQWIVEPNSK